MPNIFHIVYLVERVIALYGMHEPYFVEKYIKIVTVCKVVKKHFFVTIKRKK